MACEMRGAAVALVAGEAVAGVNAVEGDHDPVAHHLGDHRGGGDGEGTGVALDQGLLRHAERHRHVAVDQQEIGGNVQPADRPLHAAQGGLQDVDPVDLLRTRPTPMPTARAWARISG